MASSLSRIVKWSKLHQLKRLMEEVMDAYSSRSAPAFQAIVDVSGPIKPRVPMALEMAGQITIVQTPPTEGVVTLRASLAPASPKV